MSALQDQLAAVFAGHDDLVVQRGVDYCTCGAEVGNRRGFREHVAEVLASSLAIVAQPESYGEIPDHLRGLADAPVCKRCAKIADAEAGAR